MEGAQPQGQEGSRPEPTLGSCYNVQMLDKSWHTAEVVQKRANGDNHRTEYYVHYRDCKMNYNEL